MARQTNSSTQTYASLYLGVWWLSLHWLDPHSNMVDPQNKAHISQLNANTANLKHVETHFTIHPKPVPLKIQLSSYDLWARPIGNFGHHHVCLFVCERVSEWARVCVCVNSSPDHSLCVCICRSSDDEHFIFWWRALHLQSSKKTHAIRMLFVSRFEAIIKIINTLTEHMHTHTWQR